MLAAVTAKAQVVGTAPAAHSGGTIGVFSPIKAKLAAGQNVTIFVNADSTGYSDHGPFYKFAAAIGVAHDATVVLHRWAEWQVSAATGPKAYAAPVTLRTGAGPTLTMYLAALPGAVAGAMWDASRKTAAIDGIPAPDIAILHHGHNMQSFETPMAGNHSLGAGLYLATLGLTSMQWPGVPQLATTQNPWRDNSGYDKVRAAAIVAASGYPSLQIVDTHQSFIGAGKVTSLYRDNIHPSDSTANSTGAQMVADALFADYNAHRAATGFQTLSWPTRGATSLLSNSDFSTWTAAMPSGWSALASGVIVKDSSNVAGSAPWSMSIAPPSTASGAQNAGAYRALSAAERSSIAGKFISIAILVSADPNQRAPFGSFICRTMNEGGTASALRTFALGALSGVRDGLVWMVASGIPIHADTAGDANTSIRLYSAFGGSAPTAINPLRVHRCVVGEGMLPAGGLG